MDLLCQETISINIPKPRRKQHNNISIHTPIHPKSQSGSGEKDLKGIKQIVRYNSAIINYFWSLKRRGTVTLLPSTILGCPCVSLPVSNKLWYSKFRNSTVCYLCKQHNPWSHQDLLFLYMSNQGNEQPVIFVCLEKKETQKRWLWLNFVRSQSWQEPVCYTIFYFPFSPLYYNFATWSIALPLQTEKRLIIMERNKSQYKRQIMSHKKLKKTFTNVWQFKMYNIFYKGTELINSKFIIIIISNLEFSNHTKFALEVLLVHTYLCYFCHLFKYLIEIHTNSDTWHFHDKKHVFKIMAMWLNLCKTNSIIFIFDKLQNMQVNMWVNTKQHAWLVTGNIT